MELGCCPCRRDDLVERSVGKEVVVLDRELGKIHCFNQIASFIWNRCDGRHSVERIADQIARASGVEIALVEMHVSAAVRQLEAEKLVETAPETKSATV